MGELIDRQKTLEKIYQLPIIDKDAYEFYRDVRESIKSMPLAEPKNGRWEQDKLGTFLCSNCHSGFKEQPTCMGRPMFEYCPICGAKMEVEE